MTPFQFNFFWSFSKEKSLMNYTHFQFPNDHSIPFRNLLFYPLFDWNIVGAIKHSSSFIHPSDWLLEAKNERNRWQLNYTRNRYLNWTEIRTLDVGDGPPSLLPLLVSLLTSKPLKLSKQMMIGDYKSNNWLGSLHICFCLENRFPRTD